MLQNCQMVIFAHFVEKFYQIFGIIILTANCAERGVNEIELMHKRDPIGSKVTKRRVITTELPYHAQVR